MVRIARLLLAVMLTLMFAGCSRARDDVSGEKNEYRNAFIPSVPTATAFVNETHGWIGATDGIWYTEDGGRTWTHQLPSQAPVIRVEFLDFQDGLALTQASTVLSTKDGGKDWVTAEIPGVSLRAVDFVSPGHVVATDANGLLVSRDGGTTWDRIGSPLALADLDFVSEEEGWAAGEGKIWHTRNGGKSWSAQLTLPEPDKWLGHTFVRFTTENTGWVLFSLGQGAGSQEPYVLYSTTDAGQTWIPQLIGDWPWPFEVEAPGAPQGPGGYPVAFDAWADTAWVAVYSPAAGHLEVVRVTIGEAPVASDKIPIGDPRKPTVDISFVDTKTGWLVVSDSEHRKTAILRSDDGGNSWLDAIERPK